MTPYRLLASQAKTISRFKNLCTKVAKCSANIYFNKPCLQHKVTPKYAQIKVPSTSSASQSTTQKARTLRIKEELRFLHKKKEILNRKLYRRHLQVAQEWGRWWDPILESIILKINTEMERKCKVMDEKIRRLTQTQTRKLKTNIKFYPRVVNKSSIDFSDQEMELLNKSLKYNLGEKAKRMDP